MNFLEKISKSLFKDENYHSFCSVNSFFRLRNHPVKEKRRHPALGASLALETLGQCFSPRGDSTQPGTFDNVWRHFGLLHLERTTCIYWVEASSTAKHPLMHTAVPHNKIIWFRKSVVLRMRNLGLKWENAWSESPQLSLHGAHHCCLAGTIPWVGKAKVNTRMHTWYVII